MRVAVPGARGQLGAAVVEEFASTGHDVVALERSDLDVTDAVAVALTIDRLQPDVIINCTGYNDVDGAEDRPLDALAGNALAVRSMARSAARTGAIFVHYSSDFVFDGAGTSAHLESDAPNPRSVYGASKLLGEWFAVDSSTAYVLRVESLFGRATQGGPEKGSLSVILNALRDGRQARVFEDRTVSPTYVPDAARATREIVERRLPAGLYHCVNSGFATWLEIGREAARGLGITDADAHLTPVRFADMTFRAARPKYCALSNAKLAAAGIAMPPWQDALARYLESLRRA